MQELSEVVKWQGRMYAFCDFTGIVYKLDYEEGNAFPRYKLATGNGNRERPHKVC